jgi:hypothetical protein
MEIRKPSVWVGCLEGEDSFCSFHCLFLIVQAEGRKKFESWEQTSSVQRRALVSKATNGTS